MSNEENPEQRHYGQPGPYDGWQSTPQSGEYDAEATAFVHLPPEDLANDPLAAPGQGYVPPMILPLTPAAGLDPAATGSWVVQTQNRQDRAETDQAPPEAVHWPDPNQHYTETSSITADSTAQWNFSETPATAPGQHPGHTTAPAESMGGHTGQWTIPVADGDLPEESGEFAASALASQWHRDTPRPATLPGGAPAPWATQPEPEPLRPEPEPESEPGPEAAADELVQAAPAHLAPEAPEAAPDAAPDVLAAPEAPFAPGEADVPETDVPETPDVPEGRDIPGALDVPGAPEELAEASDDAGASTVTPDPDASPARIDVPSEHPAATYVLHVNGVDRPVSDAWIGESLLYVLRERLGLAGAKDGCSQGECGACNVQVDGRLVASCLVPAATAAGSEVRTVEGLAADGEPSDVQRALADCGAVQCGFCIPGMAMTVHDLLEGNHAPSELETRQALCGNLCRCSGYRGVLDAVREVVAGREANAEAAAAPAPEAAGVRIPHQAAPGAGSVQAHPHEGDAR